MVLPAARICLISSGLLSDVYKRQGKYNLKGLPAVYAAEEEAQTLIIYMKDQVTGLQVELLYGVLPEYDVITRSAKVINTEEDKIRLTKAQAACIDLLHGEFDVISFYGRDVYKRQHWD